MFKCMVWKGRHWRHSTVWQKESSTVQLGCPHQDSRQRRSDSTGRNISDHSLTLDADIHHQRQCNIQHLHSHCHCSPRQEGRDLQCHVWVFKGELGSPRTGVESKIHDFETVIKESFISHFPDVEAKGCAFHYSAAIIKKRFQGTIVWPKV